MKLILVFCGLFISLSAFAQESRMEMPRPAEEPPSLQLYPVGLEIRTVRDIDNQISSKSFWNFSFAYRHVNLSALFEYSQYGDSSGNPTSSVDFTHQELMLWGRWHFWQFKEDAVSGSLYGGLGLGAYKDKVKTTLMGTSRTDESDARVVSGLGLGGDLSLDLNRDCALIAAVEGRGLFASDFDPNPTVSGVLRLGFLLRLY
ncbi:MAG TPA: hypothetical protein VN132_08345 [Bdellovibrio sp.]|nr:hypothetical protein [Bdellovibrio sp.]